MSDKLMRFDPATGEERPYPSHAAQWRIHHGQTAWLFNPWTGERRHASDVGSDPYGLLILPDGEPIKAAPEPATVAVDAGRGPYGGRLTGDSAAQDPTTAPEPATVAVEAGALEAIIVRLERICSSQTQAQGPLWWQVEARKALYDARRLLAGGE